MQAMPITIWENVGRGARGIKNIKKSAVGENRSWGVWKYKRNKFGVY